MYFTLTTLGEDEDIRSVSDEQGDHEDESSSLDYDAASRIPPAFVSQVFDSRTIPNLPEELVVKHNPTIRGLIPVFSLYTKANLKSHKKFGPYQATVRKDPTTASIWKVRSLLSLLHFLLRTL